MYSQENEHTSLKEKDECKWKKKYFSLDRAKLYFPRKLEPDKQDSLEQD